MYHAENKNVRTFDTIYDYVLTGGETARPGAKVFVARPSDVGEARKKEEAVRDRVSQAAGNSYAATLLGDIKPDVIKINLGLRRYTMRH